MIARQSFRTFVARFFLGLLISGAFQVPSQQTISRFFMILLSLGRSLVVSGSCYASLGATSAENRRNLTGQSEIRKRRLWQGRRQRLELAQMCIPQGSPGAPGSRVGLLQDLQRDRDLGSHRIHLDVKRMVSCSCGSNRAGASAAPSSMRETVFGLCWTAMI